MTDERYGMSLQERVLALENEAAHETEREWNRNMLTGEVAKLARRVDDLERTATETAMKTAATPPEPHRMAEPTNFGAAVIDDGVVWRRASNGQWGADEYAYQNDWSELDDPQPFQNVILTADDPEPPNGSIVMDCRGDVWRRSGGYWVSNVYFDCWQDMGDFGPFTLLYRGEA